MKNPWAFRITTALTLLLCVGSGLGDLTRAPAVMEGLAHLGYPGYLAVILGVSKLLAAVAIALPGWPRLKEWAYAGVVIDLVGAALSHAASGDGPDKYLTPVILTAVVLASWATRPAGRRLEAARTDVAAQ
jgi:uncharacterized membrane protein YphA (DoxX/SURF4 family)